MRLKVKRKTLTDSNTPKPTADPKTDRVRRISLEHGVGRLFLNDVVEHAGRTGETEITAEVGEFMVRIQVTPIEESR